MEVSMAVGRPLWLQALTDYTAEEFRGLFDSLVSSAEVISGMTVGPNNPVGMSVVVQPGYATITAKSATGGKYLHRNTSATVVAIAPANTSPRVDIVTARIRDSQYGDAADAGDIIAVAGVPGASPVAPAVPAGSLLLATVSVAANASSIAAAAITAPPPVGAGPIVVTDMVTWPTGVAGGGGNVDFTAAQWPRATVQVGPSGMLILEVQATGGNNFTATSNGSVFWRLTGPQSVGPISGNLYRAFFVSIGSAGSGATNKSFGKYLATGLTPGVYTIIPIWNAPTGTTGATPTGGFCVTAAEIVATPL
jgi:hypothetical protein